MILTQTWVPGHSRTKGSLTAKGGHAEDTPQSKRWRAFMAERVRADIAARCAACRETDERHYPYAGPVLVAAYFWLGSAEQQFATSTPATWHGAGDVDKLTRNLLDAITADAKEAIMNGGAIVNDNQVVNINVWKFAVDRSAGRAPGCWLSVATLHSPETLSAVERSAWASMQGKEA